jgi:formylglycine-generating enzyme required for sulfatase activity
MRTIPATSAVGYQMGSPATEPLRNALNETQHTVIIGYSFEVSRTPITVAQWKAFIADNAGHVNHYGDPANVSCRDATPAPDTDNDPVVCTSWNDAQDYVAWLKRKTGLNYRLLSESEWEYAARANKVTAYPFVLVTVDPVTGLPKDNNLALNANYRDDTTYPAGTAVPQGSLDGYFYTSPVCHYGESAFGLCDMIGNVEEWTQDCYRADYTLPAVPKDGSAYDPAPFATACASGVRVLRGGSWVNFPQVLRSAFRGYFTPVVWDFNFGFRVARTLP